ncbi:MAG: succinate dehydrogenase assembly factor 2 [Nevskiaceae bacterium]|nr:MAG: succinate dehydrogenase assembly factor 2 [Nevskiaceae bacterium]TBR73995.1 MAG: succinate dehydrogenase assembly factor 2 [Nevskiaceae bacterium]
MTTEASGASRDATIEDRRVRWHCRRGMKELDVLLERYLGSRYAQAPAVERETFKQLLEVDDPTLWHWLSGAGPVEDPRFNALVERLRGRG